MKRIAWLIFFALCIWQLTKFVDTYDRAMFAAMNAAIDSKNHPAYKLLLEDK